MSIKIKSIRGCKNLRNKKILLRVDFNIPLRHGKIKDDHKIVRHLPTIRFLLRHNCKIVIMSHLGRPTPGEWDENFSMKPIVKELAKVLDRSVKLISGFDEFEHGSEIAKIENGEVVVLENLRFNDGEKKNGKLFAKKLSKFGEIYINDAFAVSHRAHASVSAVKKYLPAYAGLLLEKEIKNLSRVFEGRDPLIAVIGGAKLKTKLALIENLSKSAHRILIGGAMANSFFAAGGLEVGKSLITKEGIEIVKKLKIKNLVLPVDVVVSSRSDGSNIKVKSINDISRKDYVFDIGPETVKLYASFIKKANTLVWNGPMGKFELKNFKQGTKAIAQLFGTRSRGKAFGVVGGGETVEALKEEGYIDGVDWVSTGGGAMLAYLGGKKMPGLKGIVN